MYGGDKAAGRVTRAVSLYVLERTLRLLHPFLPFVTEEVWRNLPHAGATLMTQSWPDLGAAVDETAVSRFEAIQALVRAVRNARAEYGVEPAKRIPAIAVVTGACADAGLREALAGELALVSTLARLDVEASAVVAEPPAAAVADPGAFVQLVVSEGLEVYLPLSGIVEPRKEIERLTKQAAKLEKESSGLAGRLNSPKFVEKAPADVVEKSKKELSDLEEQCASVKARMGQMEALLAAQECERRSKS